MNDTNAMTPDGVGQKSVAAVFIGKRAKSVEAHISREELAAIVTAAVHYDRQFGRVGETTPERVKCPNCDWRFAPAGEVL